MRPYLRRQSMLPVNGERSRGDKGNGLSATREAGLEVPLSRPSLTPLTYSEFDHPRDRSWRWFLWNMLRIVRQPVRSVFRMILRAFTTDLASGGFRKTLPVRVVVTGVLMKLAWLPPVVVVACGWAVYQKTGGPAPVAAKVVRVSNAFSERVKFETSDGVSLSAIWVPALRVEQVVAQGDELLKRRDAAVVLVHDHGQDAAQMMAQAAVIHEMGMHALVLETRGAGQSEHAPRTFGRMERLDVAAAVEYLSSRSIVDPERVAVWGIGSGADAAAHAPLSQPIALLVAERDLGPLGKNAVDTRFLPAHDAYDALRPVCRWLFQVLYAGGPADTREGVPPLRVVDIRSGELDVALAELKAFANDRLVAEDRR
jgi:hypothetical protein